MMYECVVKDHELVKALTEIVHFARSAEVNFPDNNRVTFENYVGYITVYFFNSGGEIFKASIPTNDFKELSIYSYASKVSVDCKLENGK